MVDVLIQSDKFLINGAFFLLLLFTTRTIHPTNKLLHFELPCNFLILLFIVFKHLYFFRFNFLRRKNSEQKKVFDHKKSKIFYHSEFTFLLAIIRSCLLCVQIVTRLFGALGLLATKKNRASVWKIVIGFSRMSLSKNSERKSPKPNGVVKSFANDAKIFWCELCVRVRNEIVGIKMNGSRTLDELF